MNNETVKKIIENIEKRYIGKRETAVKVVAVLLAGGHLLIEDVPGVGKTTLAKSLADSLSCGFTRIQFTPDTLPSDVVGMTIYNMSTGKFDTIQGAIMNNIIMADEINRTSPKTQASLLEAMEEGQVTIDGKSYDLPELFMVIATENCVESSGTYILPEAQLDRFMIRISLGYPDRETELKMIGIQLDNNYEVNIMPVASEQDIIEMRYAVQRVRVSDAIRGYVTDIIRKTRDKEEIVLGASPRAALNLIKMAQAYAYMDDREFVIPDDVKYIAPDVLTHRMIFKGVNKSKSISEYDFVKELVGSVPVPDGVK
jgi:MoxR-like ATPase